MPQIKLELSFGQLLGAVGQLPPAEKKILLDTLKGKLTLEKAWKRVLNIANRNKDKSLEEVKKDVARAIKEVRSAKSGR